MSTEVVKGSCGTCGSTLYRAGRKVGFVEKDCCYDKAWRPQLGYMYERHGMMRRVTMCNLLNDTFGLDDGNVISGEDVQREAEAYERDLVAASALGAE